jgi:hypothetical protein
MKYLLDPSFQYVQAKDMDADYLKRKFQAMNDPISVAIGNTAEAGLKAGYQMNQVKIDRILAAYERALKDKHAKIPSYLEAAIAAARS